MPNYLIYIRKDNGICEKVAISPDQTLQQLRDKIADTTSSEQLVTRLAIKGTKLSDLDASQTIRDSGIPNNAILELAPVSLS